MMTSYPNDSIAMHLLGLACGIASDLAFFATVRALLDWTAKSGRWAAPLCLALVSRLFPLLVMGWPAQLFFQPRHPLASAVFVLVASNMLVAALSFVTFILGVLLVLHPLVWWLLRRAVIALDTHGVGWIKSILGAIGAVLLRDHWPVVGPGIQALIDLVTKAPKPGS